MYSVPVLGEWGAHDENFNLTSKMTYCYDDTMSLIKNIFICNYWEKRCCQAQLVNIDQINIWANYFNNVELNNFPKLSASNYGTQLKGRMYNLEAIENHMTDPAALVYVLLCMGKGKLSLCGGSLISILTHSYEYGNDPMVDDYDLFFHCESVEEADIIFNECINYINDNHVIDKYSRSQGVFTVHTEDMKIQFVRRVYKSKDQVLLGFDMAGCRLGYNPVDGFFSTLCCGLALSMGSFPLDVTQRSISFVSRLLKYKRKGFNVLLPGIPYNFTGKLKTADGILDNNRYNDHNEFSFDNNNINYNQDSDYDQAGYFNWYCISQERFHNVTFESKNFNEIMELSDEIVEKSIKQGKLFEDNPSEMRTSSKSIYNFLGDKYNDYNIAVLVNKDKKTGNKIWKERRNYYVEKAKESVKLCKENPWKYKNPESQSFGKFNPIIEDPRKWYGKHYKSVHIGLSYICFQALMDCRKNIDYINNIPNEIFKIICEYWLKAEADLARDRLYSLI